MQSTPQCRSTRSEIRVSFEDAVLNGLAPDGGLYVPDAVASDVYRADHRTLSDAATHWLSPWLKPESNDFFHQLYPFDAPLVALRGGHYDGIHVLELFHGPTLSFKDFGARFLGAALNRALDRQNRTAIVLVATSGDTGSAVADALSSLDRVRVVLLYPHGMVSPVQERQLTATRPGVQTLAVDGSFDDCQRLVKQAFARDKVGDLTSANSINIARLIPQQIYYAWAACQLGSESFDVVVPSGNLGNLSAGYLARCSGVPIHHFVAAHNKNNWFVDYLAGKERPFADTHVTLSNAMDVGAPSNAERLRYWASQSELAADISGMSVSDERTVETIKTVRSETDYLADPHTAVGLAAAQEHRRASDGDRPIVVLSTAHPAKFPETMKSATGEDVEAPRRLVATAAGASNRTLIPPTIDAVETVLSKQRSLFG